MPPRGRLPPVPVAVARRSVASMVMDAVRGMASNGFTSAAQYEPGK